MVRVSVVSGSWVAPNWNRVDLTWVDNADNEQGFKVERLVSGGNWELIAQLGANVTSVIDLAVTGATTYSYRVRAYNNGGDSANSNTASVTTPNPPPPTAPSNLVATAISSSQIKLDWTDTSNVETTFTVQRAPGGTTNWTTVTTLGPNTTTWTNGGLTPETTYSYRVNASNVGGASAWAGPVSATTLEPPDTSLVVVPTVVATGVNKISLFWEALPSATGYNVYRSTLSGGPYVKVNAQPVDPVDPGPGVVNGRLFTEVNLTLGTEYFYVVRPVYPGNIEGNASPEDSDVPSLGAIPWDSGSANAIFAKMDQGTAGWTSGERGTIYGPNGVAYLRDGYGVPPVVLAAAGSPVASGRTFEYGGIPNALTGSPEPPTDTTQGEVDLRSTTPPTGPYRGVYSKNGYTSFTAKVSLPNGADFFNIERVTQSGRAKDSGDTAYIYTGGVLLPYWIDAGFVRGANSLPGWGMIIIHAEPNPNYNKKGADGKLDKRPMLHVTSLPKDQSAQNRLFVGGIVRITFTMPSSGSVAATAVFKVQAGAGGVMRYCEPSQSGNWTEVKTVTMEQIAMLAKRFKGKKATNVSTKMVNSIAQAIGDEHPDATTGMGLRHTNSYVKGTVWSEVQVNSADFDSNVVLRAGSYPFDRRYIHYQTTNQWFEEQILHLKTKP